VAFRISVLLAIAIFAVASVYVLHDRSTLAGRIHTRELAYASCSRGLTSSAAAKQCGWKQLQAARRGDLYGLPFLALALALTLLLIYKVRVSPDPRPAGGYVRADDPVL
jgi:hypothetical protein